MIEIERKFLVRSSDYREKASKKSSITQGYLSSHPQRSVRIRISDQAGWITVKGKSKNGGLSRFEWEKEISITDAKALLNLCEDTIISKTRYELIFEGHLFEVDEFEAANAGLVIAEIELDSENEAFSRPDWLGREVTGDPRYYNSKLSRHPFSSWS